MCRFHIQLLCLILCLSAQCRLVLAQSEAEPMELKIGYVASRASLPVVVAYDQKFFAQEGIAATVDRFETPQLLMDSLISGTVDAGGYAILPITFAAMLRARTELYFATAMLEDESHRINYLLFPKDSGVREVAELKGMTVGVIPSAPYRKWLDLIFAHHGLTPSEMKVIQVAPAMAQNLLQSGQIGALFANEAVALPLLKKDSARLLDSDSVELPGLLGAPFLYASFNFRKEFAERQRPAANKVVRALDRAIEFIAQNQQQSREILSKYLPAEQAQAAQQFPDALFWSSSKCEPKHFSRAAAQSYELGIIPAPLVLERMLVQGR